MVSLRSLSNEEILQNVYMSKPRCTPMEVELAVRLEYYVKTFGSYLQEESWLEIQKPQLKML
jgi:hypothetical protein